MAPHAGAPAMMRNLLLLLRALRHPDLPYVLGWRRT